MSVTYWLDVFSVSTWREFRAQKQPVCGFPQRRWRSAREMKQGDLLLAYLRGESRWVGVLRVIGPAFESSEPIWSSGEYPVRIPVEVVVALDPEYGKPVLDMRDELSVMQRTSNPNAWGVAFRSSPVKWTPQDGVAVQRALIEARDTPQRRPLKNRHAAVEPIEADGDAVTVPDDGQDAAQASTAERKQDTGPASGDGRAHTEIQYELLKLGADMGFTVHVAHNDLSREWQGRRFADLPRLTTTVPTQFDRATQRTIELIDVLWLDGTAIVAAFEVESTTLVYSGLLRMSDLVAMQPNLQIPLFIVAPEARRAKVVQEVNRPTFRRVPQPLVEICGFIPFEGLRTELNKLGDHVRYLQSTWLQMISESCDIAGP